MDRVTTIDGVNTALTELDGSVDSLGAQLDGLDERIYDCESQILRLHTALLARNKSEFHSLLLFILFIVLVFVREALRT